MGYEEFLRWCAYFRSRQLIRDAHRVIGDKPAEVDWGTMSRESFQAAWGATGG